MLTSFVNISIIIISIIVVVVLDGVDFRYAANKKSPISF